MKLEWTEYFEDRLIVEHPAGFSIIRPREMHAESKPIFCPVCEAIMNSSYDDEAYDKFQCCDACANAWAYKDQERWKSGWRPSTEELRNNCPRSHI